MIRTELRTTRSLLLLLSLLMSGPLLCGQEIEGKEISAEAKAILTEIMLKSGVTSVTVTSTARSKSKQVNVVYGYIQRHGVAAALSLYGPEGDAMINKYSEGLADGLSEAEIKAKMLAELEVQLPNAIANNRLMHVGREDQYEVFDISISQMEPKAPMSKLGEFQDEARQLVASGRIHRFLGENEAEKEALHFELKKE